MALGDVIARLAVSLTLNTAAFEEGATVAEKRLAQSEKSFQKIGKQMQGLGKTLSLSVTAPIVAFGITSVKAARESAEAIGQVDAALKSMGTGAGRTSAQLQGLASGIMRQSLYDDDEILRKVTANMLTFGTITGQNFDRAQKAAVDLAARMGTDLQSATLMVGKALNDPVKGLGALRKAGIQFTADQKDQIEAMVASGNAAGAQALMLKELERQFGGSAKAMRDANPAAALRNAFDELQETVGAKILPLLPRVTEALIKIVDAFGKLAPEMQTIVLVGGAVAAALGPVLMGLGGLVQLAAPLLAGFSMIRTSLAAVEGITLGAKIAGWASAFVSLGASILPIIAIAGAVAAAAYLIYQNWDKISPVLQELWNTIKTTIGPPLMNLIDALMDALTALWKGPFGDLLRAVFPYLVEFGRIVGVVFGNTLLALFKTAVTVIGGAFDAIAFSVRAITALFDGTFATVITRAVTMVYQSIKTWLQDKLAAVWNWLTGQIQTVADKFKWLWDVTVGHSYVPDMVQGIADEMAKLDRVMVEPVTKATSKAQKAFRELSSEAQGLMARLFPAEAAFNRYQQERGLIDKAEKAGRLSPDLAHQARMRLALEHSNDNQSGYPEINVLQEVDPLMQEVNEAMSELGTGFDTFKTKAQITTVAVAKSFKDMAQDTMTALSNLGNAIKGGGFLDIVSAVVNLGLQLGSIGVFGKKIQTNINTPKFATGTMHHYGGLALVGERGPEIANLPAGTRVYPNGRGGSPINFDLRGAVMTADLLAQMQAMAANTGGRAAIAGASLGEQRIIHRQRRRIPG